ncbi:MAG: hypothetical protein AAFO02_21435 [Bacteroidota bacterium]
MKNASLFLVLMISSISLLAQRKIQAGINQHGFVYLQPGYEAVSYKKILLAYNAQSMDMEWDAKIKAEFIERGIEVVTFLQLFPPLREYSAAEIERVCVENGVDGIMTIVVSGGPKNYRPQLVGYYFTESEDWNAPIYNEGNTNFALTLYNVALDQNVATIFGQFRDENFSYEIKAKLRLFARMVSKNLKSEGVVE